MTLSLTKLSQALLKNDPDFLLVRYIFKMQEFTLARLDYEAAAAKIGVSSRTVGRMVKRLAQNKILIIDHDKLRLNEALAAA